MDVADPIHVRIGARVHRIIKNVTALVSRIEICHAAATLLPVVEALCCGLFEHLRHLGT